MDKELIERLAREAGIHDFYAMAWGQHFDKFAGLVAEECAKAAEESYSRTTDFHGTRLYFERCARVIRAKFPIPQPPVTLPSNP